ncbi:MAG TPA: hypothetical protein VFM25_07815 [Verrucomicrobiae bacterium]|jgi:hypothetical protein|nr:hypothetical protein [Verrucomicrobiae bacterium]
MKKSIFRWVLLLSLGVFVAAVSGCSSTNPENASSRPWNSPQGWENGLPNSMMEGH